MKRVYQKIIIIVCLIIFCLPLCGCSLNYSLQTSPDGNFRFGVSKVGKDAFCHNCIWDGGENMSFVIPDEFMGRKVTTLGGYIGSGYPCPFTVNFDVDEIYPYDESLGTYREIAGGEGPLSENLNEGYDVLTFSIHLGANVVKLNGILGKRYLARLFRNEDGVIEYCDVLCKIVYYFTVDEANSKFYAEDGKLYYRKNNKSVMDFFYE